MRASHVCARVCVAALSLLAGAASAQETPAFPGGEMVSAPVAGLAAPLPPGVGVGAGLPEVAEEKEPPPGELQVESPIGPSVNTTQSDSETNKQPEPHVVETNAPEESTGGDDRADDQADELLDEIEGTATNSKAELMAEESVRLGGIEAEARAALRAKRLLDMRVHKMHQERLREEAHKIKVRDRFNERLVLAQKTCSKWQGQKDQANDELQRLFEKSVESSSLARDGARRGLAPVLVEKELHVTDMSINALRCQMNYMESLRVFVEGACGVSKGIRVALAAYITAPSSNVTIPSAKIPSTVPTLRQINLLKLTASNAVAKVDVARHDYDVEKARVDARPPLKDPAEEADIEAAADGEEEGQEMETPPHELPMDVLFKHITGKVLVVAAPAADTKRLEGERHRILQEQEDCFGDDCGDPKKYLGKSKATAVAPAPSR